MSWTALSRTLVGELMDSPTLDHVEHRRALAGLRRINRVSNTSIVLYKPLRQIARTRGLSGKPLRVLDVACGGGDVPVAMAGVASRDGLPIELTLFDRSEVALSQAKETAKRQGMTVRTIVGDAVESLPAEAFDIVTNSLFLHHLTREETVTVLRQMKRVAKHAVLISDLTRSRPGLALAWGACRVLSRSPIVHFDGPASVRAAWTVGELEAMAREAGMDAGVLRVEPRFPCRMLLQWTTGSEGGRA